MRLWPRRKPVPLPKLTTLELGKDDFLVVSLDHAIVDEEMTYLREQFAKAVELDIRRVIVLSGGVEITKLTKHGGSSPKPTPPEAIKPPSSSIGIRESAGGSSGEK